MNNKNKYYNCFSYNQMRYLMEGGAIPVGVKMHAKTKNTFWIFDRNDLLDRLLNDYGK